MRDARRDTSRAPTYVYLSSHARSLLTLARHDINPFLSPAYPHSAGDTVFYNSNILHCASYSPACPRATLHACAGSVKGGSTRARNVLQHGLGWMEEPRFKDGLNERGRAMLERLVKMKEGVGEDVGYSLSNE